MTNVTNKFKERTPAETVALIQKFFTDHRFVTECFPEHSDVGTHYCKVNLYYNGQLVLDTNGKGMTEEYSMASGYAELYERFCNQVNYLYNPFWNRAMMERSQKERGYSLAEGERVISDEEAIHSTEYSSLFQSMFRTDEQRLRGLRVMLGDSPVTEVPYTDFVTGETVYIDPRLLLRIDRSKGCAAGNTVIEAFNQSLSELFEDIVETSVMMGEMDHFVRVSDKYLARFPELYEIIERVRSQDNELYILDFGRETGLPVLCSVLIQKNTASVSVNFGAFPVFEIALERVLTELYQGKRSYRGNGKSIRPWAECDKYQIAAEGANNITGAGAYPTGMFIDVDEADEPSACFLTSGVEGNDAIYAYFQDLCQKQGLSVCWRDTSLTPDMAAVRLFIRGQDTFRSKGGVYVRSGTVFINGQLDRMEHYVKQCYALLGKQTDAERLSHMIRYFRDIDGSYVGALLNGEYFDFRFTKNPILTYAFMSILDGGVPYMKDELTIGKRASMLRICRSFDRGTAEKILDLCGGDLDIDRLRDRDYVFDKIIQEPLLDNFAFMQELANIYPMKNNKEESK